MKKIKKLKMRIVYDPGVDFLGLNTQIFSMYDRAKRDI